MLKWKKMITRESEKGEHGTLRELTSSAICKNMASYWLNLRSKEIGALEIPKKKESIPRNYLSNEIGGKRKLEGMLVEGASASVEASENLETTNPPLPRAKRSVIRN